MTVFLQGVYEGIINGSILALIAMGIALVWGVMNILSFSQGEFLMLGMFVSYYANRYLGLDPIVAMPLSAGALFLLGIVIYKLIISRALRGPILSQRLITFALSMVLVYIAVVHTVFNVVTTAILLPFNKLLVRLAILTVPDDKQPEQTTLLDERLLSTPAVAVDRAMLVGCDMAEVCRTSLLQAMSTTRKWDDALAGEVRRKEDAVDHYEDVLGTYLVQLSGRPLTKENNRTIHTLLHTIGDFERISDHAVNLLETAREIRDKEIRFSAEALEDLGVLESAVQDIVNRTVDAFQKHDCYAAGKIEPLEEVVDGLVREVKTRHIARLQAGTCTIEYGFVLDDLLTTYERIADHCSNIAVAMIEVADDRFDTHEYLSQLKSGGSAKFEQRYEKYRGRYTFPEGSGEPAPALATAGGAMEKES